MKKSLLSKIIEKKNARIEFALITNLENSESFIFEYNSKIPENFNKYKKKLIFISRKNKMVL